ncbi:MAG: tetratricopeptide repeat protein [Taibaiella sp.]|nr:tetratricopeptide repeat protein [Taibaiella sp.]
MANSARTQPGVEKEVTPVEIIDDSSALDKITLLYEQHKKTISTVATVVVVAVVGYFGYTKWYKAPGEEKAAAAMAMPQLYFQADSMNLALNGDGKNMGFVKIEKKYDGTAAGNLAHYYAGIAYLKTGDFKKAIKALSDFDGKGTLLATQANGSLGEAYMETNEYAKAIEYFKKATSDKNDILLTPLYLYHLGLAYEANKQPNDAKETFKRIRDEYPRSVHARDMDKELARLGDLD